METLRYKIAQMLIMGFDGTEIENNSDIYRWLHDEGIGGVILFDKTLDKKNIKNLVSKEQIINLTKSMQRCAQNAPNKLPLLVSIDVEGGEVNRLKDIKECPKTPSPELLAKLSADEYLEEVIAMAKCLRELGINLNYAPLVDLAFDNEGNIIKSRGRSFSKDPNEVRRFSSLFVQIMQEYRILSCYKHFPGHGSAIGDTHLGFVDVTDTFSNLELEPYADLCKPFYETVLVMTAHVVNRNLDASNLPATLSKKIIGELLRSCLKFNGIVISDDLQMQAISKHYSLEETLTLSIAAGVDMFIFGNQWGSHDASFVIDVIEGLVKDKKIDKSRIDESFARIKKLKTQYL